MIKLFLIITCMLAFTQPQRSIEVIFIQPDGEEFTQEEQDRALAYTQESIEFWAELAPPPFTISISSTLFITTTEDILRETNRPKHIDDLGVFIVDNSNSGRYLQDRYVGMATNNAIWTVTSSGPATYIHEFGHMLWNLPHQQGIDIMSLDPYPAYEKHVLGCGTELFLGMGCTNVVVEHKLYIPAVIQ